MADRMEQLKKKKKKKKKSRADAEPQLVARKLGMEITEENKTK